MFWYLDPYLNLATSLCFTAFLALVSGNIRLRILKVVAVAQCQIVALKFDLKALDRILATRIVAVYRDLNLLSRIELVLF